jgi:hypothetical protein
MNRVLLFSIIFLMCGWLSGQTTKIIGITDDGSQERPFGMHYGYERSASLITYSDILTYGFITSLGWKVQWGSQELCPTKIYLKQTVLGSLNAVTWSSLTAGATLVYDAITSFPSDGWQTIDIADFPYSTSNLLVLCETNYGPVPPLDYPWFYYSLSGNQNKHEFWRNVDNTIPTGNGTPDKLRPDIQITYLPISPHNPPSGFIARAVSFFQVDLTWTKNSAGDNVLVAYNTTNNFGTPNGTYVQGNTIAGGGTVIYNGSGTSFNQTTGLSPATTYYYMAWSVYSSPPSYSEYGTVTMATTLCDVINVYPFVTDFESANFPPSCWSLAEKPWTFFTPASGYGIGSGSAKADFNTISVGNFDLISPGLDLSSMTGPAVKFDHAYATDSNYVDDKLELWYSTNNGSSYMLLGTWLGGNTGPLNTGGAVTGDFIPNANQWATKSHGLPVGTNKIILRGVSVYGNNLYLDNITIYDTVASVTSVTWNGNNSIYWNNASNWTPGVIPNEFQTVTIPGGLQRNPTINTTGIVCQQLIINTGATLTVSNNSEITVKGDMTIQNGAFLNNTGVVTVKGTLDIQN